MTTTALATLFGAIISFQASALIFLGYALSRMNARLARVEQQLIDMDKHRGRAV